MPCSLYIEVSEMEDEERKGFQFVMLLKTETAIIKS